MQLSKHGFHYRFISWSFGTYPPRSLCPLFWTLVAAFLLLPLSLVGSTLSRWVPDWKEEGHSVKPFSSVAPRPVMGVLIALLLFVLGAMAVGTYNYPLQFGVLYGFLFIFGIGCFLASRKPKYRVKKAQPSVVVEYVKAVKNKVCPIITWED